MSLFECIRNRYQYELWRIGKLSGSKLWPLVFLVIPHNLDHSFKTTCQPDHSFLFIGNILFRTCNEDCEIKGVPFRSGWNIIVPLYCMHRDPEFWEEPEKFDPDRFRYVIVSFLKVEATDRLCLGVKPHGITIFR